MVFENKIWRLFMGHPVYICPVVSSFFFLSFFFSLAWSLQSEIGCLPHFHTWCGLSANLECRSEICCTRLDANTGRKKSPYGHHCTALSDYIFATEARIDNQKKLLSSNTSSTCPYNMVNFGILASQIVSLVWGTPANFNGFRFLAALLHGTQVLGVSKTFRCWTEGATYIRQGGHHIEHWPTFIAVDLLWYQSHRVWAIIILQVSCNRLQCLHRQ